MKSNNLSSNLDLPAFVPDIPLALQRVGTTGRTFPLVLEMTGAPRAILTAQVEMSVSLPRTRRGVHISRFGQELQKRLSIPYRLPQVFAADLGRGILESQSASASCVILHFSWTQQEETPVTKLASLQTYEVKIGVQISDEQTFDINVTVPSFNACPCVQLNASEYIRQLGERLGLNEADFSKFLEVAPMFSHSQRIFVSLSISGPDLVEFDFRELINIVRSVVPYSYDILKRIDEVSVVRDAHLHPMFCEDVTRLVAKEATAKLHQHLPESTMLSVETISHESIHSYNLLSRLEARISDTAGDLGM